MSLPPTTGGLRETVTIQTPTRSEDSGSGGATETWATHATVYMQIRPRPGSRSGIEAKSPGDAIYGRSEADGWMRYLSTITSKMRVVDSAGRTWRIDGMEDYRMLRQWLRLDLVAVE